MYTHARWKTHSDTTFEVNARELLSSFFDLR
jgi:hypothetical protein